MAEVEQPIIKKIKKVSGGGHHGGAWKVAYADFVTAMMAFFLLLWLLSTTTPEQKMGLAEYFTPTIGLKDSMGIGFKGGLSPSSEIGRSKTDLSAPGLVTGQVRQGPSPETPNSLEGKSDPDADSGAAAKKTDDAEDQQELTNAAQDVSQAMEMDELKDYKNNIVLQESPEGLKIDMIDDAKKPMFTPGGATLTEMGKKLLDSMARIIGKSPNNISINGHTDASGAPANPLYTNWELSTDRALAARRFLGTTQLERERIIKVIGYADHDLLTPQEPHSPRNRRVTIVLLRGSYFRDPKAMQTTRGLLSVAPITAKPAKPENSNQKVEPGK